MSSIPHPLTPSFVTAAAAALLALAGTTAQAASFSFDFDLSVDAAFLADSGTDLPGFGLIGETGSASITFDVDDTDLSANLNGDLQLFNEDVSAFSATLFAGQPFEQSFDATETTDVTVSRFFTGATPVGQLAIGTTTDDVALSFFGFGVSEIESLTTAAGVFEFATDSLAPIDAGGVLAIVGLFAPTDSGGFLADGERARASVTVGVVPVPPAIAFSLTALAGLAAIRRRRTRA